MQVTDAHREHMATVSTENLTRWIDGIYIRGGLLHTAAMDELHGRALAEHIGGIMPTHAQIMAFHAAHQPHQR